MNYFENQIEAELLRVNELLKKAESALETAPKGSLRCRFVRNKFPQYYMYSKEIAEQFPNGKYIKKNDQELAEQLAQKEYCLRLTDILQKEKEALEELKNAQKPDLIKNLSNQLPKGFLQLIKPYILSDAEFIEKWKEMHPSQQNSHDFAVTYETNQGEIVRSKTEKIIADKLFSLEIPYSYEAELVLGNKRIYPDFTVLDLRNRTTYYWEHFGMMDDSEYCSNALSKIDFYARHGIIQGKQLISTFEGRNHPINLFTVDSLIEHVLGEEK